VFLFILLDQISLLVGVVFLLLPFVVPRAGLSRCRDESTWCPAPDFNPHPGWLAPHDEQLHEEKKIMLFIHKTT
jgi:hypothetical protein